jgi:hypothetical protein
MSNSSSSPSPETPQPKYYTVSKPPCDLLVLFTTLSTYPGASERSVKHSRPTSHITHHHPKQIGMFSGPYISTSIDRLRPSQCLLTILMLQWRPEACPKAFDWSPSGREGVDKLLILDTRARAPLINKRSGRSARVPDPLCSTILQVGSVGLTRPYVLTKQARYDFLEIHTLLS